MQYQSGEPAAYFELETRPNRRLRRDQQLVPQCDVRVDVSKHSSCRLFPTVQIKFSELKL